MYRYFFKRVIDSILAILLLVTLSPLLFVVVILLLIANKGKVFFYQKRPGKNEKIFGIYKFKTMNDNTDDHGELLPDSVRLTTVGKFIRKTSLDEIPQVINILKGEMSLIGPRPLLPKYLPYYSQTESKRHQVLPGISGLAQVSGRNLLNWDDRLKKDVEYVENISFLLDVKIFFQTLMNVLQSKDNVTDPRAFMLDLDEERKAS